MRLICQLLDVSRSGYYGWMQRMAAPPTPRQVAERELVAVIEAIHAELPAYGSPRVWHELRARGHQAGRHRVARLMRCHGIRARRGRIKSRPRSAPPRRRPEIPDLVHRRFRTERPDVLWCADVTQMRTGEGWLYAAVILDAFSRRIISWSTAKDPVLEIALNALQGAVDSRKPSPGTIMHSDRGNQFTSWEWLGRLEAARLRPSYGRIGNGLDNAMIESWFSSFKNEALYPYGIPTTRDAARRVLFQHIVFHNTRRRHSALGYTNPDNYEAQHATRHAG